jgi:hypothetical protein
MPPKLAAYSLMLPMPNFLGKVAVIVAAEKEAKDALRGESYLLVERGTPRIYADRITCNLRSLTDDMQAEFDLDFIIGEALMAAESRLAGLRLKEFENNKDWNLFNYPLSRTELKLSLFAWSTALSLWPAELQRISVSTQQSSLTNWLDRIRQIQARIFRDDLPLA